MPKHHLLIQQKYAAIQAASAYRSTTQGVAFDKHDTNGLLTANALGISTSTVNNGRVVSEETVWLDDNTSVSYVAFSFMSDELLKTGSLPDNKPTATTQVWRHYNNKWCPVLAFQPDNQTPLLGFSVASSAAWIEQQNNQVTYRLFVGTAEGKVGKLSFVDTDPKNQFCNETIGFADSETTHAIFYTLGYTNGTPINGMKLAEFQESKSSVNQPLEMDNKRVLYWWGNTSDCTDAQCGNWHAEPARSALLVNGQLSSFYDSKFYSQLFIAPFYFNLDADSISTYLGRPGNRTNKTKVGDVDLRLKYDNARQKVTMDWAIVYQTLPTDKLGQSFSQVPNITTRSFEFQLNGSEDQANTAWGISGLNTSGLYSYYSLLSTTSKVSIFDFKNDPSKPYLSIANKGDLNNSMICPIIGSRSDCFFTDYLGIRPYGNLSASRVDVADIYKGWGFENIGLFATNYIGYDTSGVLISEIGDFYSVNLTKNLLQGYDGNKFVSKVPFSNTSSNPRFALDGTVNVGNARFLLVPDLNGTELGSSQYARLFVILPIIDNLYYNPTVEGSSKTNVNGGIMMCTGKIDVTNFIPPKSRQPHAIDLLNALDCSQEWVTGKDSGYKYAAAQDIVLNGTYKTSLSKMSISISANYQVLLSYVSAAGAILELDITDPNQSWAGQTSWTMISQGRAAECHNELDKPTPPTEKSLWQKALNKLLPQDPSTSGDTYNAAVGFDLVDLAEVSGDLACEDFGDASFICGKIAGYAADFLTDAFDSKARSEGDPYKKLYEETRELTKCTGG